MRHEFTHKKRLFTYLGWFTGSSLLLGLLFQSILNVGQFWPGFLAASFMIFLSCIVLFLAWGAAGAGKTLAWMMALAFLLRLFLAVFISWGMPRYGYQEPAQEAGFVFADAYRRESAAWVLAQSDAPLTEAFSDQYEADQYGGILAISAFVYRRISSDAFRPTLISILTAAAMGLSLPFLTAGIRRRFSARTAIWAGWILALYPEGLLLGSAQMREPFFILFFSIMVWGAVQWLDRRRLLLALLLFIFSMLSLFLLSFRIAIPIICAVLLLVWLEEAYKKGKSWLKITGWFVILLSLIAAFWLSRDWIDAVLHWDTLQTVAASGRIQFQLEAIPKFLHFPFILIYGLFQPVLPAAIAAPAPWIWQGLGIFRALGWYLLLPMLAYGLIRIWKVKEPGKKRWLMAMVILVWAWIFIASARGGGDQWDNPRYRTIFLPWMAVLASWGLNFAMRTKDRWFFRGLAVEGIFLAFFTEWYISRYYPVIPRLDFWVMIVLILLLSLAVILGGWIRDRKESQKNLTDDRESI